MTSAAASTTNTEILSAISNLDGKITAIDHKIDLHIATDAETGRKTAELYTKIVTGNGVPSLIEKVRTLEGIVGKMPEPSRVVSLEKWQSNVNWGFAILATLAIVDFGTRLLELWKGQ